MSNSSNAKQKSNGQADKNLIPRQVLFGNPDKAHARLSPDGKRVAFLAPVNGVLNVWVGPIDNPAAAKAVTNDTKRGIRTFYWAYTNKHVIYRQDQNGDENWHVYSVNLDDDKTTDLTPLKDVAAQLEGLSHRQPGALLVNLNNRDPQLHDIYRIEIATGERKLVQKNPGFAGFVTDDDFRVRFATRFEPDGSNQLFEPDGKGGWKKFINIPQADTLTTSPIGFDKSGDTLYMLDSRGRDTGALTALNLKTNKETVLAASDKADINGVISHPTENTILAASYEYTRKEWEILDDSIKPDMTYLRRVADGDIEVTSQSLDNQFWIVAYLMDNGPIRYYHYDRGAKQAKFLFSSRKDLEDLPLVKMRPEIITASDGLKMVSFLSLPNNADTDGDARPERPLPMVLLVHGGPWARDTWGFDSYHQWLANRGYAVLSVNFRGSTGFGKAFLNAGARSGEPACSRT